MPEQRPLRLLTLHPGAAPETEPDRRPPPVPTPVAGGGFLLDADATLEERRAAEALVVEVQAADRLAREGDGRVRFDDPDREVAAARAGLSALDGRRVGPALRIAARLFVEHGDDARHVLWRDWRPDWEAERARIDSILARAGVSAGDVLL